MTDVWLVLVFVLLALVLGLWLMRPRGALPARPTSDAPGRTPGVRPIARHAGHGVADHREQAPSGSKTPEARSKTAEADVDIDLDVGPPTILSWMAAHEDAPHGAGPAQPSAPMPLWSSPMTTPPPTPEAYAASEPHEEALEALRQGRTDVAWALLQDKAPPFGSHSTAWLEALEKVAQAYEREQRFVESRDVYQCMADMDPHWRNVKLRLMRARGLAQNAKANAWGTVPAQPLPQSSLRQLGRYLVEREIGRGAMGAVYLGYDPATDRRVALKTMALAHEFSGAELADARTRFLREAEMSGRLEHPDIVSIIDAGEDQGLAWIAMELVEGQDLSAFTTPGRLLPLPTLNGIFVRVAEALAYAHTRGVTHRDIKPANIMFDRATDRLKVMDFGVARVADGTRTRTGVVLGTPTFMSPEQLAGQTIDGRSDLYSLGVAMFQLLTGRLPYRNDSMAALMRAIAREPAPHVSDIRPDVPRALGDVVALALQKHPHTRYTDGHQMAADLRAVAPLLPDALDLDLN